MKTMIAAFVLTLVSACTNLPADPAKMSPDQLREWAKDKNANISCGIANTPVPKP